MSRRLFLRILLLLLAALLLAILLGCAPRSHARVGFYPAINPRYRCEGTTMVKPGVGAYCDGKMVVAYDGYDVSAADGKTAK